MLRNGPNSVNFFTQRAPPHSSPSNDDTFQQSNRKMVNYSKFEAIVQAEVEDSHETTQHVLTLLDLMILLPPREEFPVPLSRASMTRHPPLDWASFIRFQMATDARDFIKCLRMPLEAFECLHKMLKVDIRRNKEMAQ